jgi:Protein of unknown function (DUF3298).
MERRPHTIVETVKYQRVIKCHGWPVLRIRQSYPRLANQAAGAERINRYYKALAERWRLRWEEELGPQACEALVEQGEDRPPWEAVLDFTVTYDENDLLSLYMDAYEFTGGAHGHTVRRGDTWEVSEGLPQSLFSFFPGEKRVKRRILAEITAEAQAMQASGEHAFFDDYETLIREHFDAELFYVTAEGLVVFYPLYAIGPYVEGFVRFVVSAV